MIYIIYEIILDSWENEVSAAVTDKVIGYTNKNCWAIYGEQNQYFYKLIDNISKYEEGETSKGV